MSQNQPEATTGALPAPPTNVIADCRLPIADFVLGRCHALRKSAISNRQSAIHRISPGLGFKDASVRIQPNQAPGALQSPGQTARGVAANILRSGRRERECKSPRAVQLSRSVAQSSERPAWDREAAGGNPAVPTSVELRVVRCELSPETARPVPLPNSSHLHPLSTRLAAVAEERGIRLLSEPMQVQLLPAAPTPAAQSDNSSPPAC